MTLNTVPLREPYFLNYSEASIHKCLMMKILQRSDSRSTITAPRGLQRSCKGWIQEAALRMLMNNLDPAVAEKPQELIVYGGTGKAARNWECFDAIVESLKHLENDETLLVQSGKPVGIFRRNSFLPLMSTSVSIPFVLTPSMTPMMPRP